MITILDPGEQLKYLPMASEIKQELETREKDKLRMINKVPFLRVTCLQTLTFSDGNPEDGKQNNLIEIKETFGVTDENGITKTQIDGFIFELNSNFDDSYGSRQVIGTELRGLKKLYVNNPRRVPPPRLQSFTATVGEEAGFYTTGKLQFTANSKEQIEFLTPFLLHPGNTVVFEFGHSDRDTTLNGELFSYGDVENFLDDIIYDPDSKRVQSSSDLNNFFKKRQQRVLESNGNYEYLVGVINNFDFKLNQDFGFDITIDVWSISKTILSSKSETTEINKSSTFLSANKEALLKNSEKDIRRWINTVENKKEIPYISAEDKRALIREWQQFTSGVSTQPSNVETPQLVIFERPLGSDDTIDDTIDDGDSVITLDTSRGSVKYITLRKILEYLNRSNREIIYGGINVKLNPYLVSSDNSCVFFRKQFPTLRDVKLNEDTGYVNLTERTDKRSTERFPDIKFSTQYEYVIPISSISIKQPEFDENKVSQLGEAAALQSLVRDTRPSSPTRSEFGDIGRANKAQEIAEEQARTASVSIPKVYKPFKIDTDQAGIGDILNIYYDSELFIGHYVNYQGKANDIIQNILSDINFATKNIWDLKTVETFNLNDSRTPTQSNIVSFSSRNVVPQDRTKTYTFKFNQQESIVTELSFDLGLEGLIADQIYFESINQTDNSIESTKLNLLLFEKHEKNIQLTDKRNEKLSSLYQNINRGGTSGTSAEELQSQATGSFKSLYSNDPSSYLLSFLTNNPTLSEQNLLLNLENVDNDGKDIIERLIQVSETSNSISPLIEPNYEIYQKAMKGIGSVTQKNEGETSVPDDKPELGGVNPLLESRLTMTIPGIGGIQPLQFFNTDGLPDVYDKRGDFCILSLSQTITPDDWSTSITAAFRVKKENE